MPCPRTFREKSFQWPDSGPRGFWLKIQLTTLSYCSHEYWYLYLNVWTSCMDDQLCRYFFLRILQTNFSEYVIVNMNGGQNFSLLEAKNHICSNEGAQSVKSLLKQEQSLIAWPLSESLAISLPLAWRGVPSLHASFRPGACDEASAFRKISKGLVHCLVSC